MKDSPTLTRTRTDRQIRERRGLLFEESRPGRRGIDLPPQEFPEAREEIEAELRRERVTGMPELSEVEVIRHYTRLSRLNFAIDLGLYPLGSCTMKHNPKVNEWAARLPGFARVHPYTPERLAQGSLELMHELETMLQTITGMDAVSLQPSAGAQGELTGVMVIRAYLSSRGNPRKVVLVPDSAHGTNPATVRFCGYEVEQVRSDAKGCIEVDKNCRSSLPRVYAVGDVVRGPMLAHKGEDEGVMVAEIIAGQHGHVNYDAIPWVMYTMPEIAWVGKTEQQLKAEGVAYRSGRFPFAYNGRALGRDESEGFIKMLADASTDRILGVHAIGSLASELISEAVVAIEFGASSEDIARICHAHPSMSEVMREAALAVHKRSLNG